MEQFRNLPLDEIEKSQHKFYTKEFTHAQKKEHYALADTLKISINFIQHENL